MIVLKNAKLVPELTEGTTLTLADVVLEDDTISQILPPDSQLDGQHEEFDLKGKTLLPGLIDMHVHLFMGKRNPWNGKDRISVPAQRAFDCLRFAQFLLDLGFTTVRDVGDTWGYPAIAARNAINDGDFVGPTIQTSGVTISPHTAGFEAYDFMNCYVEDPYDMRRIVREQFEKGVDLIKLYGTGSMMVEDSLPGRRILEADEVREAVTIAKRKGSYCACHCHGAEAIGVMIDCGVHTIEHASFITDESCKKLDGRKDIGIVPTLCCSCQEMNRIDGYGEAEIARYAIINEQRGKCLRNAYENYDILMGWGTDLSLDSQSQAPFLEWQQRKEVMGVSNIDLLKQATINSAILMNLDNEIGTVKVGKKADLIVVDGDPVQDITVMYQKPLHILRHGTVIR